MNTRDVVNSTEYAEAFAEALCLGIDEMDLSPLPEESDGDTPAVISAETYADHGMPNRAVGMVIELTGGARVLVTIQAYVPRKRTRGRSVPVLAIMMAAAFVAGRRTAR